MQILYIGNFKILLKEIRRELKNRQVYHVHGFEDSILLRSQLSAIVHIFNTIPVKSYSAFQRN